MGHPLRQRVDMRMASGALALQTPMSHHLASKGMQDLSALLLDCKGFGSSNSDSVGQPFRLACGHEDGKRSASACSRRRHRWAEHDPAASVELAPRWCTD